MALVSIISEPGEQPVLREAASVLMSMYKFNDKVRADGGDVLMTVTGFMFTTVGCQVECSWFSNGSHNQVWFYEWRLAKKEG
jgi:uncharacterized protein YodC (DUF2158 family)